MENFAASKACSLLAVPPVLGTWSARLRFALQKRDRAGTRTAPMGSPGWCVGTCSSWGEAELCWEPLGSLPIAHPPGTLRSMTLMLRGGCCCCITYSLRPSPPDPQHSFLATAWAWDTAATPITDSKKIWKVFQTSILLSPPTQTGGKGLQAFVLSFCTYTEHIEWENA